MPDAFSMNSGDDSFSCAPFAFSRRTYSLNATHSSSFVSTCSGCQTPAPVMAVPVVMRDMPRVLTRSVMIAPWPGQTSVTMRAYDEGFQWLRSRCHHVFARARGRAEPRLVHGEQAALRAAMGRTIDRPARRGPRSHREVLRTGEARSAEAVPDLSRYALQQGQVALQDARRRRHPRGLELLAVLPLRPR